MWDAKDFKRLRNFDFILKQNTIYFCLYSPDAACTFRLRRRGSRLQDIAVDVSCFGTITVFVGSACSTEITKGSCVAKTRKLQVSCTC